MRQLPHDNAVDLFARASPEVLTRTLRALLLSDEARAVAILADLDAGKAAEFIGPLMAAFPWLPNLPEAAEEIAQRAMDLKWGHEVGTGRVERAAQSLRGTNGYFRQYRQGRIYWSRYKRATYAVQGLMAELHLARGDTSGELGFPTGNEYPYKSELETEGTGQRFEGGRIFSSTHGTYLVPAKFEDADDDWLGFPVSAVETVHDGVSRQCCEGGFLFSSDAGTFAVRSQFAKRAKRWVPISAESDVHPQVTGRMQRFRGPGHGEIAVHSTEAIGMQWVSGRTLALYEKLGGPGSWLGFPTATQVNIRSGRVQRFEHGSIYLGPDSEAVAVAVPAETVELVGDVLGWPVSQEKSVGGSDDEAIQYFENGVVVLRDGKREILVRPEPVAEDSPLTVRMPDLPRSG